MHADKGKCDSISEDLTRIRNLMAYSRSRALAVPPGQHKL
jgi:hypothetical protein